MSYIARVSRFIATAFAVGLALTSCSGTGSTTAASNAMPALRQPQGTSGSQLVLSLTPTSLTFFHATSPAQTVTIVLANQRTLTTVVQDSTVASAVLNPGSTTSNGTFTETITVTPLKAGITDLFINDNKGTVATVPIDVYGELSVSSSGQTIFCKSPDSCNASSTKGGVTLTVQESFYPNSFNASFITTCQTLSGTTVLTTSGTFDLQLSSSGYTTLVNNALTTNQKTQQLNCTVSVSDDHSGTQSTSGTFTITFTTLQRGATG